MKGEFTMELNDETMRAALQKYFTEVVFDASQLASVVRVEPKNTSLNTYGTTWKYLVTLDSSVKEPA